MTNFGAIKQHIHLPTTVFHPPQFSSKSNLINSVYQRCSREFCALQKKKSVGLGFTPPSVLLKSLFKTPVWEKAGPANTWDAQETSPGLADASCSGFSIFQRQRLEFFLPAVPLSPSYLFSTSSIISFPCIQTDCKYFDRTETGSNYTSSFAGTSGGMATSWPAQQHSVPDFSFEFLFPFLLQ